jgi:uncharacterized protein DUF3859
MTGSRALAIGSIVAALCVSQVFAQDVTVEMLWSGLFGPFSRHPPPDDPLPDVTLFPFGEIPRPLVRTSHVPAKLGTRFGLLFSLHGAQAGVADVRVVFHYPSSPETEDRVLCLPDKPCYFGYVFERREEISLGEWRMELLVNGVKVHEARFVVEVGI